VDIVLEFVPGGSLDALLAKFGKLSERIAVIYAKQILEGLAYLHSHNIIHR
jgi:serine/threonine protein kinase